jgi:hypothetical protein
MVGKRCNAIQSLHATVGLESNATVCRWIRQCEGTEAMDGFLYNTCLLAIDRSLTHKQSFMDGLKIDMHNQIRRGATSDQLSRLIEDYLACHVDVLLHTSHIDPTA